MTTRRRPVVMVVKADARVIERTSERKRERERGVAAAAAAMTRHCRGASRARASANATLNYSPLLVVVVQPA